MSTATGAPIATAAAAATHSRLGDLLAVTKPRVVSLISLTTAVGYWLGAAAPVDPAGLALAVLGTALAGAGSLSLNMLLERDRDRLMERTRERPYAAGRLGPTVGLAFGVGLVACGLAVLALAVEPVAALVVALTVASYLFAYTPLKPRTVLCTMVGAVPGALPPVAGWAAATGGLEPGAWSLFGILFLWQMPHALAIARLYRDDYARGGFQMLPVVDPSGRRTGRQVVLHALALTGAAMAPSLVGIAGGVYLVLSAALGLGLVLLALGLARDDSAGAARRLYRGSLVYMTVLLVVLALDKVPR
jgi:protoheme IX farnesyltransferase